MRVASTRARSARTTVATRSAFTRSSPERDHRTDLDGAVPRAGDRRRDLDRLVEVGRLEGVEAGQGLLRLRVRAVAGDDLAALAAGDPHGGGRRGRVERLTAPDDGGCRGAELLVLG